MSEPIDIEINDLPPEETLTVEEKEQIAGGSRFQATPLTTLFKDPRATSALGRVPERDRGYVGAKFQLYDYAKSFAYAYAEEIRQKCGDKFRLLEGPMKSLWRAQEKNEKGTGYEDMKDIIRVTIVAPDPAGLETFIQVMKVWGNQNGWQVKKDQVVKADSNDAGYSGLNYVISRTSLPDIALLPEPVMLEVQANVCEIIYGKETATDFIAMFGNDDKARREHETMRSTKSITGGLGHALYEIGDSALVLGRDREDAKKLSKRYYNCLRGQGPNGHNDPEFINLCKEMRAFINRPEFQHFFKDGAPRQVSLTPLPSGPTVVTSQDLSFKQTLATALAEYEQSLKKAMRKPSEESTKAHARLKQEHSRSDSHSDILKLKRMVRWYMGKGTIRLEDGGGGPPLKSDSTFMQILKKAFPRDDLLET